MTRYPGQYRNRKSIRLEGYDYSQTGLYFITICCQNHLRLFGKIENGVMLLNDAGKMIEQWYNELENKYPDKKCREMVIMPNHFHCILENIPNKNDGDKRDTHDILNANDKLNAHVGTFLRGRPYDETNLDEKTCSGNDAHQENNNYGITNQKYNASIGDAVGWFKTMTTNRYICGVKKQNWKRFDKRLWQRNYYEHIIRNEQAYHRIAKYIMDNPKNWKEDKFNKRKNRSD